MKITILRFTPVLLAAAALLAATGLRAQTTDTAASPGNPPPLPVPSQVQSVPSPQIEADVSAVYAFRLRTTGVSVDLGGFLAPHNFLGFEYSNFSPTGTSYDPIAGPIHSKEDIDSYQIAYRYSAPLALFDQGGGYSPVNFYLGAGIGTSTVQLKSYVPNFNFQTSDEDNGVFSAEADTGVEWDLTRNIGLKVGYRYVFLSKVSLYGERANIDTGAIDYGIDFKW